MWRRRAWGEEDEALVELEAAEHEVSVVVVDEVALVHEAYGGEDGAVEEDAAGWGVLDLGGVLELAGVDGSVFEVVAAVAEEGAGSDHRRPRWWLGGRSST